MSRHCSGGFPLVVHGLGLAYTLTAWIGNIVQRQLPVSVAVLDWVERCASTSLAAMVVEPSVGCLDVGSGDVLLDMLWKRTDTLVSSVSLVPCYPNGAHNLLAPLILSRVVDGAEIVTDGMEAVSFIL